MNDSIDERQNLASALRKLRTEAGLSTTDLAKRLGWSQSRVSRIDLGRTLARPRDVEAWTRAIGAGPNVREELVASARRLANEFTDWRRGLAPGRRRVQEEIQRLEDAASVIRVFAPVIIAGLAQTRTYMEAMFRLGRPITPVDQRDEVIQARINRQAALTNPSRQLYLLMGEAALRRRVISPDAMCDQVERLIELSQCPNVILSVIPFGADEKVHQYHGFAVLGDPEVDDESIVLATTVTRAVNIRSDDEIAQYIEHFEALRSAAVEGEELGAFLREVIADLADRP